MRRCAERIFNVGMLCIRLLAQRRSEIKINPVVFYIVQKGWHFRAFT